MVLDKSFIKKSSKEKRAMEPTINNTGWNSEFFNTLSLVKALTVKWTIDKTKLWLCQMMNWRFLGLFQIII